MASTTPTSHDNPTLPTPFTNSTTALTLITQGAEAHLYKTTFLTPDTFAALKIRPVKKWRHPALDRRLTRHRILAESRVLAKCRKEGVVVPAVLGMSWEEGWVALEWVEGKMVKQIIREGGGKGQEDLERLLKKIGAAIGKLHSVGVIHGDLTTSNMLLRPLSSPLDGAAAESVRCNEAVEGEIVLIDFGLATQATQDEDRAVDLYVLERAFGSTHPREEAMFPILLEAYAGSYKGAKTAMKRLEDVRMRGRKKSMIG